MLQTAIDKVMVPWLDTGYTVNRKSQERFVFATILALLANRNPYLETLTSTTLRELHTLDLKPEVRSRVGQLQRALIDLHIVADDELEKKVDQPTPALFQDDFVAGIHPRWVVWLRAFWQQTPISQHGRHEIAGHTSLAFRWV